MHLYRCDQRQVQDLYAQRCTVKDEKLHSLLPPVFQGSQSGENPTTCA
jgi:hypothetical protein